MSVKMIFLNMLTFCHKKDLLDFVYFNIKYSCE